MKVSIITINYNNAKGLKRTIDSVIHQSYPNYEFIIIDGGSNDGSVNVIKNNGIYINYWESAEDNGVYHAMNKGIKKAVGEYLLFLNSGDELFCPDSLGSLINHSSNKDIVYGDLFISSTVKGYLKTYPKILTKNYFRKESLPHPAMLFKRVLFERFGCYDLRFKICSDWAFYLRAIFISKCSYQYIPQTISTFYLDGISSNKCNYGLIRQERLLIWGEIFPYDKWSQFLWFMESKLPRKNLLVRLKTKLWFR